MYNIKSRVSLFFGRLFIVVIALLSVAQAAFSQSINIIPQPSVVEIQQGTFNLSSSTRINYNKSCEKESLFLQRWLLDEHALKLAASEWNDGKLKKGDVYLKLSPEKSNDLGKEGYKLSVSQNNILIEAAESGGIFYGIQSLRQLVKKAGTSSGTVPCLSITDKPRFGWRAFMLDEARYFKGASEVKRILDEMALLKMNVFHWHLTDDTGWRIEIKKYPRLTEVGSTRKESEMGTWLSDKMDGKVHSGFYTQEQIKDIVRYAEARHITIIPEIEMPGHASAAIASYPWLYTENQPIEVPTKFRIQLNVFNVANAQVIQFLHNVLDEVMLLFPSNTVHIGGDEVKYDQWKKSEEVQKYMMDNGIKSPADLQIAFTNGISQYLKEKKHRMMGWNEILGGHHTNNDSLDATTRQKLSDDVIIHFWTGNPKIAIEAAEKGYDVVNSYYEYTYLDYDHKTTSLEKAYSFDPVPATLPSHLHSKILGLGCQMWGEWIPTVESMNKLIYPRIAAFSEIGWSEPKHKNFERFKQSLDVYWKQHWKKMGIVLLPEFRE